MLRRLIIVFAFVLLAAGCAKRTEMVVVPPSEGLRAELRILGLLDPQALSLTAPNEPVKGTENAALSGASQMWDASRRSCRFPQYSTPGECYRAMILMPVLMPVGAIVGALKSRSTEEVEKAHNVVAGLAKQTRPNQNLLNTFKRYATDTYGTEFIALKCPKQSGHCNGVGGREPLWTLDLHYRSYGLESSGQIEPDVHIVATIRAVVYELSSRTPVYSRTWGYKSKSVPYFELPKNGGLLLKKLFEDSHQKVASAVAYDLFEIRVPIPTGKPKAGSVWTEDGPMILVSSDADPGLSADRDSEDIPDRIGADVESEANGNREECSALRASANWNQCE